MSKVASGNQAVCVAGECQDDASARMPRPCTRRISGSGLLLSTTPIVADAAVRDAADPADKPVVNILSAVGVSAYCCGLVVLEGQDGKSVLEIPELRIPIDYAARLKEGARSPYGVLPPSPARSNFFTLASPLARPAEHDQEGLAILTHDHCQDTHNNA